MLGKGGVDLGPFVLLPPVGLGPPVDPGQGSLISVLLLALLLDHLGPFLRREHQSLPLLHLCKKLDEQAPAAVSKLFATSAMLGDPGSLSEIFHCLLVVLLF